MHLCSARASATLSARLLAMVRPKSRVDLVLADVAVLELAHHGGRAERDLVHAVAAVDHQQRVLGAEALHARTWMPTRSGWNTPIRMLGAPAGLVSGPRMLKIVRTPSSLRTGATFFIAGWWLGANMKPMPVSAMHFAMSAGSSGRLITPSASSTSALPDFDETLRLPCC